MPSRIKPPPGKIAFAVANCRFVEERPNGIEEVWVADVKAVRRTTSTIASWSFQDVIFVERPGKLAWIHGVATPDERSELRCAPEMVRQVEFLDFLSTENARDIAAAGRFAGLFPQLWHETVAKATGAYMSARLLNHTFRVGFARSKRHYELIDIDF